MRPRISVITLGVADLKRALEFYRDGLGLNTEGIVGEEFEDGAVIFFDLENGLKLALWPHQSLAKDATLPLPPPPPPTPTSLPELSLGHNVASEKEVDEVMAQASKAGANIVKPAHKTFWGGYSGYFQDPDGHLWEIVYNPQWPLPEPHSIT